MEIRGVSIREHKLSDGWSWEWEWPFAAKVERELRWTKEAHKWVIGMRVDHGGWTHRELTTEYWQDIRTYEAARGAAELFIDRDLMQ